LFIYLAQNSGDGFWLSLLLSVVSGLMTKQCVLLSVCDLVWLYVFHTVVHVVTRWMLKASMRWCAKSRTARHQVLDDIIWRSLGSASIPATKEPSGFVVWQGGKSLAWDVTVVRTLAQS